MILNDNNQYSKLAIANLATGGVIGTAVATVDICSLYEVTQTTAGQTLSLPTPSLIAEPTYVVVVNIGSANFTMHGYQVNSGSKMSYVFSLGAWRADSTNSIGAATVVAMTPFNSPVETVVAFDGFEIKWHNSLPASYDGIALRVTAGTRNIKYTQTEFYLANSVHDAGKSTWGSDNMYYAIPNAGATATLSTPAFPHLFSLGTTFVGIGNPALPQSNYRIYHLKDHTNSAQYRITVYKNGPVGESFNVSQGAGTCEIIVERMGITTNQVLSAGTGISITSGVIASTIATVLPATVIPIADNEADAAIRTGIVGTSLLYARQDHNHPITRQTAPTAPVIVAGGLGLVITSQAATSVSDEESVTYSIRVNLTQAIGVNWHTLTVPAIAGFQAPVITLAGTYRSAGTPGGYPAPPNMGQECANYQNTAVIYMNKNTTVLTTYEVFFKVQYIRS